MSVTGPVPLANPQSHSQPRFGGICFEPFAQGR